MRVLRKRVKKRLLLLLPLALLLTSCDLLKNPAPSASPDSDGLSIHFIDVGQADAALVECGGKYMLIDGGNADDSDIIYTVLKREGVKNLDIVVGTHPHEDHIGGLTGAYDTASADLTLSPTADYDSKPFANFKKYADKNGGVTVPDAGDTFELGGAQVEILAVNTEGTVDEETLKQMEPFEKSEYINDTSIVLKLTYGDTEFLFTGDAGADVEQALIDSGADIGADLLKVGHHGSNSGTTDEFLKEVTPDYAVISVGSNNEYGHPKKKVLNRLKNAGAEVLRTDTDGDVYVYSDGKNISVEAKPYVWSPAA